ncbi:MAG: flagellar hook-associated protein FlgL [Lachnospiraceae bacterium]|nr:flagellar hook-associated protein FlgL [Lachnospiraceae bacterium]
MRITTKVIQNNSLQNINTNKLLQDKLSQQMSTEKKVTRPSDDPIVAIRALRLRTNVNQVTQYYEKNVPDAESWLEVTESALSSMSEVVTDMIAQCTKGSNEDLTTSDRETILTALKALRDEVYSTGNADYAGRYIFTGYRTDTPLTFEDDKTQKYTITEQVDNSKIDTLTFVDTGDILGINESNFDQTGKDGNGQTVGDGINYTDVNEYEVEQTEVYRMRLSYNNVDELQMGQNNIPNIGIQIWDDTAKDYKDIAGNPQADYTTVSLYDEPYKNVGPDEIRLVKETGELILGKNVYDKLMSKTDDPETPENEGEIRIKYEKSEWEGNDLRPEHYFACSSNGIDYNPDYLNGISDEEKQTIEYDVGLNQTIRVNTTADEVFTHDISRDVEDMVKAMEDTIAMEKQVTKLKKMVEENKDPDKAPILEKQLAAAEKAFTLLNEKTQQIFETGITKMQKHLDAVNFAVTENGTRGQKLELISNRLMSQKTNFETLRSENEDIDITDVAIKLSSAELTYSSALMATGKVLQNNLINFI